MTLAACGRLGFDASQSTSGLDAPPVVIDDGGTVHAGCATAPAIPATITATGHGAAYTDFVGGYNPVSGVMAQMIDVQTHAVLASAVTDASGLYTMSAPTNGAPISGLLQFTLPGYYTTTYYFDAPWISDVQQDGQVISDGGVDSIYSYDNQNRDMNFGTLFVEIRDCSGQIVEGTTLEVTPAIGVIGYSGAMSSPDPNVTSTAKPAGDAWAFNAEPGVVHMAIRRGGAIAYERDVTVLKDQATTWAIARVLP